MSIHRDQHSSSAAFSDIQERTATVSVFYDYLELTKPRLLSLVLLSTSVGFYLAMRRGVSFSYFFGVILATAFVGAGAMALNQVMEWKSDAKMIRTRNRPVAAGRLSPAKGLIFGLLTTIIGIAYLFFFANRGSAFFAGLTSFSYLLFYTPLKKWTSLATFAGAIPGALPPLIGWSAAGGDLNIQALSLFLIIFFWQVPHFLSIDCMYKTDYERAGFPTLAVVDKSGRVAGRQMALNVSALLCVSLLPTILGMTGSVYFFGTFLLGICFAAVIVYALPNLDERARFVLRASVAYLSLVFILMVGDKGIGF